MMILLISYIYSVIIAFGMCFGYFQREWLIIAKEYFWRDIGLAALIASLGPIGILTIMHVRYTFKVKHRGLLYPTRSYYNSLR